MLKEVYLGKEIVVTVINKIGVLADMSTLLAGRGINLEAVAGYALGNEAKIMLVTNDNLRAIQTLKKANYNSLQENEAIVITLEDKPGALKYITTKLAAGELDIKQIYGTVCPGGCPAKIILSTSNNKKALAVLKK